MKICVLGCGPAGLMAALAIEQLGHEPHIIGLKVKSKLGGSQYLHRPIADLTGTEPESTIKIMKQGVKEDYAEKVYKDRTADVSYDKFETGEFPIWSLRAAYDRLWERYQGNILDMILMPRDIHHLRSNFPLILSSVPADKLCHNKQHVFHGQQVWINQGPIAAYPWEAAIGNLMYYMADLTVDWYRYSRIFRWEAWEFSEPVEEPWQETHVQVTGVKPTTTDCDCHLPGERTGVGRVERIGRFGRWQKGVLTHHAYEQALERIESHALLQM